MTDHRRTIPLNTSASLDLLVRSLFAVGATQRDLARILAAPTLAA